MILEEETFEAFGYYSCDFKKKSWKLIVSVCTLCGRIKITPKHDYYTFCQSCVQKGKKQTEEAKAKQSAALKGENSPFWKPKVKSTCLQCGKEFPSYPRDIKKGGGKYCCVECKYKSQKANLKGKNNHFFGKKHTDESKALMSDAATGNTYCLGYKQTEEHKQKESTAAKSRTHNKKPRMTAPENAFGAICVKNDLPFKFVGDGALWLGNANPDFVHTRGRKIVVEVFGDWFHAPLLLKSIMRYNHTLEGRKKQLKKEGYKSIFIWESDLKRKDAEAFVMFLMRRERII